MGFFRDFSQYQLFSKNISEIPSEGQPVWIPTWSGSKLVAKAIGRRFVEPNLGPNCLQKSSAEDARRNRVNPDNEPPMIEPLKSLRDSHVV